MTGALIGAAVGLALVLAASAFWEPMKLELTGTRSGLSDELALPGGLSWMGIAAGAGVCVVIGMVTGRWIIAMLAGTAVVVLPSLWKGSRSEMVFADETDAVAAWVESLRDLMRGAHGIEGAVRASVDAAPEELRAALRRLRLRQDADVDLPVALVALADEVDNPVMDVVVTALLASLDHVSSELATVLDEIADRAREMAKDHRLISVSRQKARTQLRLISWCAAAGLPLVGFSLGEVVEPLTQGVGRIGVMVVIVWCGAMLVWMAELSTVEEQPRVLDPNKVLAARRVRS